MSKNQSKPTREEITKSVLKLRKDGIQRDSYLNCGAISAELKNHLMEKFPNLKVETEETTVRYTPRSTAGSEHMLLSIPSGEIKDISKRLYIDGSIDQFCEENKDAGKVGATLPSKNGDGAAARSEFEPVEVFTRQERPEWFEYLLFED